MADDDVTELARILHASPYTRWCTDPTDTCPICLDDARAIVEAGWSAHIRAEALRDAANWLRDDMDEPWGMRAGSRLDARADRIEREGRG